MKGVFYATTHSGVMDVGDHFICALRSANKNGANSKSRMSRNKFFVFWLIVINMSLAVNAQKGKMGLGFYGAIDFPMDRSDIFTIDHQTIEYRSSFTNYGIGGKLQVNITEPIRLEGSFGILYGMAEIKSGFNDASIFSFFTDFSVNAHYRFKLGDNITPPYVYPIVGVTFLTSTDRLIASGINEKIGEKSGTCLNIGCGIEQNVKDKMRLFTELKYCSVGDGLSRVTLSFGFVFLFFNKKPRDV